MVLLWVGISNGSDMKSKMKSHQGVIALGVAMLIAILANVRGCMLAFMLFASMTATAQRVKGMVAYIDLDQKYCTFIGNDNEKHRAVTVIIDSCEIEEVWVNVDQLNKTRGCGNWSCNIPCHKYDPYNLNAVHVVEQCYQIDFIYVNGKQLYENSTIKILDYWRNDAHKCKPDED